MALPGSLAALLLIATAGHARAQPYEGPYACRDLVCNGVSNQAQCTGDCGWGSMWGGTAKCELGGQAATDYFRMTSGPSSTPVDWDRVYGAGPYLDMLKLAETCKSKTQAQCTGSCVWDGPSCSSDPTAISSATQAVKARMDSCMRASSQQTCAAQADCQWDASDRGMCMPNYALRSLFYGCGAGAAGGNAAGGNTASGSMTGRNVTAGGAQQSFGSASLALALVLVGSGRLVV